MCKDCSPPTNLCTVTSASLVFTEVVGTCGLGRQHRVMSCTSPQVNIFGMKDFRLFYIKAKIYTVAVLPQTESDSELICVSSHHYFFWDTSISCLYVMSFFIFLFLFILLLPLKWAATYEIFYRDKGLGQPRRDQRLIVNRSLIGFEAIER